MLEYSSIQLRGFHNTKNEKGEIVGFQFCLATRYYKGMWLSQFRAGDVIVDGEHFTSHEYTLEIGGTVYTLKEMQQIGNVYWQVGTPATIRVKKPGGLAQGYHTVGMKFGWSCNYIGVEMEDPVLGINFLGFDNDRKMLLVR